MFCGQRRIPLQPSTQRKHNATREDILVEQSLVERAQRGDSHAIGKLYEKHAGAVRRLLLGILGTGDHIDDLVQDVFVHVFQSIHAFRGDSRFSTWLHRVASNTALSHLRKKMRTPIFSDESTFPSHPAMQLETTQTNSELRELYHILDTLSPKRRIAFILYEIEQYTIAEIADMTGTNTAAVKSRLFFGRREIEKKAKNSSILKELMSPSELGGES